MKKLTIAFLFAILVNLTGCGTEQDDQKITLRIGVIGPLTGSAGAYGQWVKHGVDAALEDYRKSVQGSVAVYYEDDQGDPKKSVSAYRKLKSVEGIDAVISVLSSSTLALKPVIDADKTVLITPVASHPDVTADSGYVFRNTINSAQEAEAMVDYITRREGLNKFCLVYINDPGGIASKEAFQKSYQGSLEAVIPFEKGALSFRSIATVAQEKCQNVAGLYVTGYGKEMGGVIRDLRQQGLMQPMYTNQGVENSDVLAIAGKTAAGIKYTFLPDAKVVPKSILAREPRPGPATLMAYEAANILIQAFDIAAKEGRNVPEVLHKRSFHGVLSEIRFGPNGDVKRPIAIKRLNADLRTEQVALVGKRD